MVLVKLTIVLWVAFLIMRFFVRANMTPQERIAAALGKELKMTFGRILFFIVFLLSVADSFAALVWFLFFR